MKSLKRELIGAQQRIEECAQIAGQALGYPWFKDDQENFPGSTTYHGVCIGEHVAETIVDELATKYQAALTEIEQLKRAIDCRGVIPPYKYDPDDYVTIVPRPWTWHVPTHGIIQEKVNAWYYNVKVAFPKTPDGMRTIHVNDLFPSQRKASSK